MIGTILISLSVFILVVGVLILLAKTGLENLHD